MADNKDNKEWNDREIGALWVNAKQGSNEKYLTGQINGEKVIMFKNKYKDDNPKAPDFRIYKQKDQEEGTSKAAPKEEPEEDLI
jgi:uncharacterized protein (DUF736 family)